VNLKRNDGAERTGCELKYLLPVIILIALAVCAGAQNGPSTGTLRGQVTDPSGAVVPNAVVTAFQSGGTQHIVSTNRSGAYEIGNLPAGAYTVTVTAKGFEAFVQEDVNVAAGPAAELNVPLEISVEKEKVNVQEETPQVDMNPANNANAIVLSGKDLDALSDDPDELQQDLEALAGPSAGPNGGQIYIDGFTGGQLPPKSSIREIRINQNPFSSEYDKLGFGRIEVFTKPGTDKFHGQFSVEGNSSAFNSRNPFLEASAAQPYYSTEYMGNIGGPLNKHASFFFNVQRRNINEIAVVNAQESLDGNPTTESVPNPRTRTNLSPRLDYQLTPTNTLTARYQYYRDTQENAGVGGFNLPSTGNNTESTEHTLQVGDTQTFGAKAVNETRFSYVRDGSNQTPLNTSPTIVVPGAFTGGGSSAGADRDVSDHYEVQNYTSLAHGKHFLKFGARLRAVHEVDATNADFNGTFFFQDLQAYQNVTPLQLSFNATKSGSVARVPVTMVDAGLYVQDDFKVRPTLTLSYGLRFETQNGIGDHGDWAPRVGFAWGIGGGGKTAPKTVLRGGFGIFYDRFSEGLILNTDRQNGITQQQYVVANPTTYPNLPDPGTLSGQQQSIYQINSQVRAPYVMQTAFSLERQVTKVANVTVSYLNSRGVHQLVSVNANAPTPGTPYSTGPVPDPNAGPIYQYISEGIFKQNQLITNFNVRAGAKVSLFGFYMLGYANSDTSGSGGFASDSYDVGLDYGRAAFDVRHRVVTGGSFSLPYGFRVSPFVIFNSGAPYNVAAGQDLNNDSQFNDRPAFAVNPTGNCVSPTAACHYVVPPTTYMPVPVNYLTGPNHFTLNLRLAKAFAFGPETGKGKADNGPSGPPPGGFGGMPRGGGGGGFGRGGPGGAGGPFGAPASNRRYSLTFSVSARNILNHVNPANPIGTITSNLFGQSNALAGGPFSSAAANRKIELQAMFSF